MCLIAQSNDGTPITRETFDLADRGNPDGIGIMTAKGFARFLGPDRRRKAWRYLERHVFSRGLPYAIHFRWATDGENSRANTHPHLSSDGRFLVMHNGILSEFVCPVGRRSDTALFVEQFFTDAPDPEDALAWDRFRADIERRIGYGNRLSVLHRASGTFHLFNEWLGDYGPDGIWYSNTYTLPASINPMSTTWRIAT